ncbi:uncharacterized protein LOC134257682 [Saccostrea cucullata]|uniref:uncharacterized protein LOC134257682 n=1 Tax=Saccostrea cuccullata TaxID=36930 RepID=UPI002ED3C914
MAENKDGSDTNRIRREQFSVNVFYLKSEESVREFITKLPRTINVVESKKEEINAMPSYGDYCLSWSMKIESSLGDELTDSMCQFWKMIDRPAENMPWFQIIPHKRQGYMPPPKTRGIHREIEFLGGSMTSPTNFVKHWETAVSVDFQQDKSLLLIEDSTMKIEINISPEFLHDYVIVHLQCSNVCFYFNVKYSPKVFSASYPFMFGNLTEIRLSARDLPFQTFGSLSCFCLKLKKDNPLIPRILWYIQYVGLFVAYTHVTINDSQQMVDVSFSSFEIAYAWESLCSQGFKVVDHLTKAVVEEIISLQNSPEVIHNMVGLIAEKPFIHFISDLCEAIKMTNITENENNNDIPGNLTMVRCVLLTPTKRVFLPKELVSQNRILRQYNEDYFIRLVYRDEDYQKLTETQSETLNKVLADMKRIFVDGFIIHNRHYEFLGCSNSQLREHSFWFFSSYDGITADGIRQRAGDLSKERCVASYVSRFGLCFSASQHTLNVGIGQGELHYEADIERNGYCFTDGIGKISRNLALKVAKKMNMKYIPSAFQIRYGGCKGVVALDPSLGEENVLVIRESMRKFQSGSTSLEVLQVTRPVPLHLNRQVITLLSGLGIQDEIFLDLQESMLMDLSDMLLYNDKALKSLQQLTMDINFQELFDKGISFVREPFFRSLLLRIFQQKLHDLKRRSRIQIPLHKGRYMMGTSDETQSLKYGQVFIQYSKDLNHPQMDVQLVVGRVVVTKNPCFHPGDIRIFEAVCIPHLSHMVDCIVFPQLGPRPHPDEMSGSDLDGDEYFVCWDERLSTFENVIPMKFPRAEKTHLERDVELSDIAEFLANYIKNDNLGIIANAHLALADSEQEGIFSVRCIELAKMHSDAVDFPKTGKCPPVRNDIRPKKYPDIIGKKDKIQYFSSKVLGKLFYQCQSFLQNIDIEDRPELLIDDELVSILTNDELKDAILQRTIYNENLQGIMNMYGIQNEVEAISGSIKALKRKRGCLKDEEFQIGKIVLEKVTSLMQRTRKIFFEEFGGEQNKTNPEFEKALYFKASAWYTVTYTLPNPSFLSFPWVVADILCKTKKGRKQITVIEEVDSSLERRWKLKEEEHKMASYWMERLRNKVTQKFPKSIYFEWIDLFENGIVLPENCNVVLGFQSEDYEKILLTMRALSSSTSNDQFENDLCYKINLGESRIGIVRLTADERIIKLSRSLRSFLKKNECIIRHVAQFLYDYFMQQIVPKIPPDVIKDILPIMLLKESFLRSKILNTSSGAQILFNCLRNVRVFIQNISNCKDLPEGSLKWLIRNSDEIVMSCLVEYMKIARCLSVEYFNEDETFEFEVWDTFKFSSESLNIMHYAAAYAKYKLSQITGADMFFHQVEVGKTKAIQIDAHGTRVQMLRFRKALHDFLKKSESITTGERGQTTVEETFSVSFEGCSNRDEQLTFDRWSGPCQNQHNNEIRYLPCLVHASELPACIDFERTFSMQWEKIKDEYNPIFHGNLSIVLSFGNFYVMNVDKQMMTISELNRYIQSYEKRRFELLSRRQRGGFIRIPYSFAFLPISGHYNNLSECLNLNFEKINSKKEVKVRLANEGMCDLDEHMNCIGYSAPQIKWLVHQIVLTPKRRTLNGNQISVRCKIQSFRSLDRKAIESMEGMQWLLDIGKHVVKTNEGYDITSEDIKFIREKETDIYGNRHLNIHEGVWRSMRVGVSKVKEYQVRFRQCTKLSEKTELVIIPAMLDINSSDEEVNHYSKQLWDIALHFGKELNG